MKSLRQIFVISSLILASSCAMMFNDDKDQVTIGSSPAGADVFIGGRNYGKTPVTLTLQAKNQIATVTKEGYGSAQLQLEAWAAMKNGKCVADAMGTMLIIPYYSLVWSGKCNQFREKEYMVTIPYLGARAGNMDGKSMVGLGQNPAAMNNYYYNGAASKSAAGGPATRPAARY